MHHVRNYLIGTLAVVLVLATALTMIANALVRLWPMLLIMAVVTLIFVEITKRVFR